MRTTLLALACSLSIAGAARADDWQRQKDRDGIALDRRSVAGSDYFEYRAQTTVKADLQRVLQTIWSGLTQVKRPNVFKHVVIRQSESEFVVYEQVGAPVVMDRDVTLRIVRAPPRADGSVEIRFESTNEGPPVDPKFVRIPIVRGAWRIEPAPSGTRVTYTCYSEPGGTVPAFMVRGSQQDQAMIEVRRVLALLQ